MPLGLFLGCSTAKAITIEIPPGFENRDFPVQLQNKLFGPAIDLEVTLVSGPPIGSATPGPPTFDKAEVDDTPMNHARFSGGTGVAPEPLIFGRGEGGIADLVFSGFPPGSKYDVEFSYKLDDGSELKFEPALIVSGGPVLPPQTVALGRVLINRPAMSAFGLSSAWKALARPDKAARYSTPNFLSSATAEIRLDQVEPLPHPRHRHGGPRLASRGLNAALVQRPCCRPMR
jgi:hypothetical protein